MRHTDTDNTSGQQGSRVVRQSQRTKDTWCVVQHSVNTSPLLEEHSNRGDDDTTEHRHGLEQRADSDKLELEGIPRSQFLQMRELFCGRTLLKH